MGNPQDAGLMAIAKCWLARAMAVVFVGLTAAVSLAWSHEKLLSQDEIYAFQTDRVATVAELVHVQRTWPISLDPLLYHLLSHAGMKVFGVGPAALRLPAFLGFLLMQICLFFFVRNLAGERAGAVAAGFPALTATLYYSAEGRPYGLMLGLYALALLCWQAAVEPTSQKRDMGRPEAAIRRRRWPLAGLAVALAATINSHYFGVLLLVPVCAAEVWRTVERRRVDWPVWAAICVATAGFLATVPFLKGAAEFKTHYYNGGEVGPHDITRAYRSIFLDYTKMNLGVQHLAMAALVVFAAALVCGCVRAWRRRDPRIANAEWVLLLALAALPFCGYLMARFVTHSIEVRYVLGALVAISAMVAVAAAPWLRRDGSFAAVLVLLGLGIVSTGVARVRAERRATAAYMAQLLLPPDVKNALDQQPDGNLYIQDMGTFELASHYEPDPDVRARITLLYSRPEELRWDRHDTMSLTAEHLRHFTALPIVSYAELKVLPGEHILLLGHSGWDWTDQALAQDGAHVRPVGLALGEDVAAVRF